MPKTRLLPLALIAALALAGCGEDEAKGPASSTDPEKPTASAELLDADGRSSGSVTLEFGPDGTVVEVQAQGLRPGPHGLHVHTTGRCEAGSPDPKDPSKKGDFLSAGGHLAADGQRHGSHDGDLPSLVVAQDGTASLTTTVDSLPMPAVLDDDGSALMVHVGPDNFANVPERYAPGGPDEMTTKTGDSGGRVLCGALTGKA